MMEGHVGLSLRQTPDAYHFRPVGRKSRRKRRYLFQETLGLARCSNDAFSCLKKRR